MPADPAVPSTTSASRASLSGPPVDAPAPTPPAGAPRPPTLADHLDAAIDAAGGWLPFDAFMEQALYAPGLGYYARGARVFGRRPEDGSDFVTAPELSPLFGRLLARQVDEMLQRTGTREIVEVGAGAGTLAAQLLDALGPSRLERYHIVELSAALRERQRTRLAGHAARVAWLDAWPAAVDGIVVGNEVLDAMPVTLLAFDGTAWHERGVRRGAAGERRWAWADRPTERRPPRADEQHAGCVTEVCPRAAAFVRLVAGTLRRGGALLVDYGFPEHEYYLPDRIGGTLMCHRGHVADADPLADVGDKDITAHVDFTAVALAAQQAGLEVAGWTTQGRFLLNLGLVDLLADADPATRADAHKLIAEHEMGELFKVLALLRGAPPGPPLAGFAVGDRTHRL